jgi:hypothetical protein
MLGTERSPLQPDLLPEPVRARLDPSTAPDPESLFYRAAALTYLFEKAGSLPGKMPLPDFGVALPETNPYCSQVSVNLLKKLLEEPNRREDLLELFFGRVAAQGQVIPPELLTDVLHLGNLPGFAGLAASIRQVTGERGSWMVQFNPAWQYLTPPDSEETWTQGSNAARRQMLQSLRLRDPEAAYALIRDAWTSETNARERKELLKILQINLRGSETDFLESIYAAWPEKTDKSKPVQAETRALLVEMLLSSPDSALFSEISSGLKGYVNEQKTMLGLRSKRVLSIPDKPDGLLNPTVMSERLGFDASSPLPGVSDTAFWFCELVRTLHPTAWERVVHPQWPDILSVFEETARKTSKWPLLQHLTHALARTGYREGIRVYTDGHAVDESNYLMLNSLSESELERYVLRQPDPDLPGYLREILQREGWQWSKNLSKEVLKRLMDNPAGYQFPEFVKILGIGVHLDPGILPDLQALAAEDPRDWQQKVVRNQLIRPLLNIVKFKQRILA